MKPSVSFSKIIGVTSFDYQKKECLMHIYGQKSTRKGWGGQKHTWNMFWVSIGLMPLNLVNIPFPLNI